MRKLISKNKQILERKFIMKKFLSIVMVAVLVLALSITAFAANTNGSITVTNATKNTTYKIYKIFDATISTANGETDGVSYSITPANPFFAALFGNDGTTENAFFNYNKDTGSVEKKNGVNDSELIQYLTKLVNEGNYPTAADPIVANSDEVKFSGIPYGYYLVTSSLGTTVTINSNTPDVKVIDKNQVPGNNFNKLINTGVDENGDTIWGESNSANIGDQITYKISFDATNYDGDKLIKYYQIHDEKGDAIWAEFNSFQVFVNGVELKKGYYLAQGGENTDNWEFLGDWSDVPVNARNRNDAEWYLVHLDYDKFRITIPWLTGCTVSDVTNTNGDVISYSLNFAEDAESKFDSPALVEVKYDAVVEAGASIGSTTHGNRYNKAYASWTSQTDTDSTTPKEVVTYVYGIGLLKDDIATLQNLAGAKFRLYSDEDCTTPVYVIPTDVEGVYMLDSLGRKIEDVSGVKKQTPRDIYEDYLEAYLGANTQDNYMVTPVNGKIVILGLKEGTYYLKEVEAPSGYNALTAPIMIKAGEGTKAFSVFADENGSVADILEENGTHSEIRYDITSTVVHNSKGVVLPSTGGAGTVWLITIGALLAIGFAVFLITHKKMSVYTD